MDANKDAFEREREARRAAARSPGTSSRASEASNASALTVSSIVPIPFMASATTSSAGARRGPAPTAATAPVSIPARHVSVSSTAARVATPAIQAFAASSPQWRTPTATARIASGSASKAGGMCGRKNSRLRSHLRPAPKGRAAVFPVASRKPTTATSRGVQRPAAAPNGLEPISWTPSHSANAWTSGSAASIWR